MADFPYTIVTGKLKKLFGKIQEVGIPKTVNGDWLSTIGFTSSNDRSLIPVLQFIGFIDDSKQPTDRWRDYRNKSQSSFVLAEGIKLGYEELYRIYHNAEKRSDEDLKNFFRTKTNAADEVIGRIVTTFKTLCSLADFSRSHETKHDEPSQSNVPIISGQQPTFSATNLKEPQSGVTININIELSLPATTDEKIYDNLFAALKKHLLSGDMSSGS